MSSLVGIAIILGVMGLIALLLAMVIPPGEDPKQGRRMFAVSSWLLTVAAIVLVVSGIDTYETRYKESAQIEYVECISGGEPVEAYTKQIIGKEVCFYHLYKEDRICFPTYTENEIEDDLVEHYSPPEGAE